MTEYTFVCYAHEDTKFALKLARQLQGQGISIWLDQWQDANQEQWDQPIEDAVRRCQFFLIILSPAAVNSWLVHDQTLQALRTKRQIVPVIYQPCQMPIPLQDIESVNYAQNSHRALEDLALQLTENVAVSKTSRIQQVWQRLRWNYQIWGMGLLGLVFIGLSIFYSWSNIRSNIWPNIGWGVSIEKAVVPAQVQPVIIAEAVFVPTVEIATPVADFSATPIKSMFRPQDGNQMVFIPQGDFLMGSTLKDDAANSDEYPQHLVFVDAFWMDKTEITNAQYQLCLEAGDCTPGQTSAITFQEAQLPVVGVTWQQAVTYCAWVKARLPTEAEWEKAARGVDSRLYPWGNEFDSTRTNYCDLNCVADWRDFDGDDGYRYTAPVGSYAQGASPFGVLDMSGNVWEWTADWYTADAYRSTLYKNPTGPENGLQRVLRGGSWLYSYKNMRVAQRNKDVPTSGYDNIGFRCMVSDGDNAANP